MLSKKILSFSLSMGLAAGLSTGVFANGGQPELSTMPVISCASEQIMNDVSEALMISGCREYLLDALCKVTNLAVASFCYQLKYCANVNKLTSQFKDLYSTDEAFRTAVNEAWVCDPISGSQHASSPCCINKHSSRTNTSCSINKHSSRSNKSCHINKHSSRH